MYLGCKGAKNTFPALVASPRSMKLWMEMNRSSGAPRGPPPWWNTIKAKMRS